MHIGIREFLDSPWNAQKLWISVSVPLSVMGITSLAQNLFDFGSLIIYLLIFYQKIADLVLFVANIISPINIKGFVLDYLIIGSPFFGEAIKTAAQSMIDQIASIFKSPHPIASIVKFLILLPISIIGFCLFIFVALMWPLLVSAAFYRFITGKKVSKRADANYVDGYVEGAIAMEKFLENSIIRFKLILMGFFILSAFSFGIERWVDPDFLSFKPEHLGINKENQQDR